MIQIYITIPVERWFNNRKPRLKDVGKHNVFFFHMVPITEVFIAGSLAQIRTHPRETLTLQNGRIHRLCSQEKGKEEEGPSQSSHNAAVHPTHPGWLSVFPPVLVSPRPLPRERLCFVAACRGSRARSCGQVTIDSIRRQRGMFRRARPWRAILGGGSRLWLHVRRLCGLASAPDSWRRVF